MEIGLIDVDSHNFPNLALMKLSAYHKAQGHKVEFWQPFKHYDVVYKSKVFTDEYSIDPDVAINTDLIIKGGTGYGLDNKLPPEIEHIMPDYNLYHQFSNTAYGFLTRGCPRACPFCIVSEKEGQQSVKVADLNEFWNGQKNITLLDPNILACKDHENLLQQLADSGVWIDFTQGLDARLLTETNCKILKKIKTKMVHFAFDKIENETAVVRGLKLFKQIANVSQRKQSVYILTNFNTTFAQDFYRVNVVKKLEYMPDIRIYNKTQLIKDANTNPEKQLIRWMQRWANNRFTFFKTGFLDYEPRIGIKISNYIKQYNIELNYSFKNKEE